MARASLGTATTTSPPAASRRRAVRSAEEGEGRCSSTCHKVRTSKDPSGSWAVSSEPDRALGHLGAGDLPAALAGQRQEGPDPGADIEQPAATRARLALDQVEPLPPHPGPPLLLPQPAVVGVWVGVGGRDLGLGRTRVDEAIAAAAAFHHVCACVDGVKLDPTAEVAGGQDLLLGEPLQSAARQRGSCSATTSSTASMKRWISCSPIGVERAPIARGATSTPWLTSPRKKSRVIHASEVALER